MSWILFVVALLALVAIVFSRLRSGRADVKQAAISTIVLDPRNDKVIIVQGWREDELRKILEDFIDTYRDDGYPPCTIEQHQQGERLFRLRFPGDIHPLLFTFLINYLAYPFDFNVTNRSILVVGETTLSSAFEGIDQSLVGQQAILYLPENDRDYNIVHMQSSSGVNLANVFSELVWKRINDARLSNDVRKLVGGD